MVMDMDILVEQSEPATRAPSPTLVRNGSLTKKVAVNGAGGDEKNQKQSQQEVQEVAPPPPVKKIGNLMKELKQDVQQGAMEFNMDSFF
jgi:hypothetical protein